MRERARIATYFAPLAQAEPGSFALTDDAAALTPPVGQQLIVTTDSVIESIHVLPNATATQFAQKLMRRNLSDLASMGATPWRYTLNMHTPRNLQDAWFAEFASALAAEQQQFGSILIGGDSTSGAAGTPVHVTMTCFGLTPHPLRRAGAQVGDDLYVSGTIGDAAVGLKMLQQFVPKNDLLIQRYHLPQPRLALGVALRVMATAAIDISDGLLADVAQLCSTSQVGVRITREAIPRAEPLQHLLASDASMWENVLNGGDDYELCFTATPAQRSALAVVSKQLNLPITRIGEITAGDAVTLVDAEGIVIPSNSQGWEHR